MAESKTAFIMNADLSVGPSAIREIENYLFSLDKAVIAGPQGSYIDWRSLRASKYFEKGAFDRPVRTHDVSGFLFAIHLERFFEHRLLFDVRFSPCFFEEWDMGLQVIQAGLASYAVPVTDFEHCWGVSRASGDARIKYFGKDLRRDDILVENRRKFVEKWGAFLGKETESGCRR